MAKGTRLPESVTVPVDGLFAGDVGDALLVTMLRLTALCGPDGWTPPLPPNELAAAVGRRRSTLYRHLQVLAEQPGDGSSAGRGWVEVRTQRGGLSVRPAWKAGSPVPSSPADRPSAPPPVERGDALAAERKKALAAMGIQEPKLSSLASRDLDLSWIESWARWLRAERWRFRNPQGFIIRQLEADRPPPARYLSVDDPWADWEPPEDEAPANAGAPADAQEPPPFEASERDEEPPGDAAEETDPFWAAARAVWGHWQNTAEAVLGPEIFGRCVAHAAVVEAGPDGLVIAAANEEAARWLEQYAGRSLRRAWLERTGREGEVLFAVAPQAAGAGSP